jgi:hypothetical protein
VNLGAGFMIRIIDLTVRPRTPVLGEWLTPRKKSVFMFSSVIGMLS